MITPDRAPEQGGGHNGAPREEGAAGTLLFGGAHPVVWGGVLPCLFRRYVRRGEGGEHPL